MSRSYKKNPFVKAEKKSKDKKIINKKIRMKLKNNFDDVGLNYHKKAEETYNISDYRFLSTDDKDLRK